jgi:hypothetical protein
VLAPIFAFYNPLHEKKYFKGNATHPFSVGTGKVDEKLKKIDNGEIGG